MYVVCCSDGVVQHSMGTNDLPASALKSSPIEEEVSTAAAAASGPCFSDVPFVKLIQETFLQ
jgi:hypothetical protein